MFNSSANLHGGKQDKSVLQVSTTTQALDGGKWESGNSRRRTEERRREKPRDRRLSNGEERENGEEDDELVGEGPAGDQKRSLLSKDVKA